MIWLGLILGLVFLAIFGISLYGSLEVSRVPFLAQPYTPEDFGWSYETVSFLSHDGLRLSGWFLPADPPSPVTIIIQHGVGSNSGDMLANTVFLMGGGKWNLFYYDFRGHGNSEGSWTSLGPLELKDMKSALLYLKTQKPEASRRLAIYGHSLGAAVAIIGAAQTPELEGVAAESPFAALPKTVGHFSKLFYGIPSFPFMMIALWITSLRLGVSLWNFKPLNWIGKIAPRPIFIIHAERDRRMPLGDTRALWDAAGEPKELWIVPGADHGEPWMVAKEEYERRLIGFFRKVFP